MSVSLHANRGSALEDLITMANGIYRTRKTGMIHKVPTAWLPLRGRDGRVVSAKVEQKAAVDFLGHVFLDGQAVPLAFDAKETAVDRWPLSRLEQHQYEYLADCHATGAFALILMASLAGADSLSWHFRTCGNGGIHGNTGPAASVGIGDPALVEVRFLDYLSGLRGFLARGETREQAE